MNEQLFMVTGANSGIGLETAKQLAKMGAGVIMVARSRDKGEAAQRTVIAAGGHERVHLLLADLSAIGQVKRLADEVERGFARLDGLINNAAIVPGVREVTEDGLERQFAVNHLAYFILGVRLLPLLARTAALRGEPARMVNVSSNLHEQGSIDFDDLQAETVYKRSGFGAGWGRYNDTKLMNVLFTYELARKLGAAPTVTVNAMNPGLNATNLTRSNMPKWVQPVWRAFGPKPERGARTTLYAATAPDMRGVTGKYLENAALHESSPASHDADAARRLWTISAQIAGIDLPVGVTAGA